MGVGIVELDLLRARRLTMVFTAALAVTASPLPAQAGSGTVSGTLLDDDTGGFAAGITVSACGSNGCVTGGRSDLNGRYTMTLPAGTGWNVFTEIGDCPSSPYARSHKYGVNVVDGGAVVVDLHLTRERGVVSGRVLDQTGAPVSNVGLVVDNAETGGFGIGGATSGADGRYTVGCLATGRIAGNGTYYITAFPPAGGPYGQQQDAGIAVRTGATSTHNVVLQKGGGVIAGRVTCGGGACPSPVSVLVYCEGCTSAANTQTELSGAYATGHLQAGHKYDVHAVAPAGWDNEIHYGVSIVDGQSTNVNLDLTRAGSGSSGRLTGHIADATGAPYSHCLINAFGGVAGTSAGGWTDGDVHSGVDGSFDTDYGLVPGDYLVFLVCPGWPQVDINGGRPVAVRAGAASDGSYVFLERGRPFSGGHTVVGTANPGTQAFFAAGSTAFSPSSSRHEVISVMNPGDAQMVAITYLLGSGDPMTRLYPLSARTTSTINVNADVGPNQDVSAWLTASAPFVAERSMYFLSADGITGGTDVMGTPDVQTSWYFAEGSTAPGFTESLVLLNPNLEQGATAAVTYYLAGGELRTVAHVVPPLGRLTVAVNDPAEAGSWASVATRVLSDFPIVAERSMSFRYGGVEGAHDVVGSPAPSTTLNLAEGHVDGGFDEYVALLNTNDVAANATITYVIPGFATRQQTVQLVAGTRTTLHLNDLIAGNVDCSIHIEADLPITAERVSYFAFASAGRTGGDAAMAVPDSALSLDSTFAGHAAGPGSVDYFSAFNPGPVAATVTFSYATAGGLVSKTVAVAANSRFTELAGRDAPGLQGAAEISSSVPVLVERASYFAY